MASATDSPPRAPHTPTGGDGPWGGSRGRGGRRRAERGGRRRAARRRGRWLVGGLLALVLLGAASAVLALRNPSAPGGASGDPEHTATLPTADRQASADTAPSRTAPAPRNRPSPEPPASRDRAAGDPGPRSGTGTFTTAELGGERAGRGDRLRRYSVLVEEGTGIVPEDAAREIAAVLADPRGWTANGQDSFQMVAEGPTDFEVKIATPETVDRICGAAGLRTRGEVNCSVGSEVVVNLKRWNTGSPQFAGPIGAYRALIVNHEVGHRIGHGHETCPGPGRPAPAMMQQIDGLKGCVANAWPYDANGTYLAGPSVP
ncbi:DUF3152 domain-containing protein [Streptomyces sp. NPDC046887]|uniref:DUF3152 domain-containing protein n=1 Tax=Streptomyces sp. NPDC046887 TaxID=3155472 RepID=UPI0033D421C3